MAIATQTTVETFNNQLAIYQAQLDAINNQIAQSQANVALASQALSDAITQQTAALNTEITRWKNKYLPTCGLRNITTISSSTPNNVDFLTLQASPSNCYPSSGLSVTTFNKYNNYIYLISNISAYVWQKEYLRGSSALDLSSPSITSNLKNSSYASSSGLDAADPIWTNDVAPGLMTIRPFILQATAANTTLQNANQSVINLPNQRSAL